MHWLLFIVVNVLLRQRDNQRNGRQRGKSPERRRGGPRVVHFGSFGVIFGKLGLISYLNHRNMVKPRTKNAI